MGYVEIWNEFQRNVVGKYLFLFGVGDGAAYFCTNLQKDLLVEGVLDNDIQKQGELVSAYLGVGYENLSDDMVIQNISFIENYAPDEVVVLITSLGFFDEIERQLREKGFNNCYILKSMIETTACRTFVDSITKEYINMPVKPNKLVFYTMGGYSGHGKAIAECLLNSGVELDIVWMVDDLSLDVPEGIRLVLRKNKLKYLYEMYTARFWIYDDQIPNYIDKKAGQTYIQVKHWSSVTLKAFGHAVAAFRNNVQAMENWKHDSKAIDYIFTGSEFDTRTCREGFCYDGKIVELGSPRTDILFKSMQIRESIFKQYAIDENTNIVMYAPTFRVHNGKDCISESGKIELDFEGLKYQLERKFGGTWSVFLRLHPRVAKYAKSLQLPSFVINVSDYRDGEELVAASDIVITDYSSIMFEPAFVNKPVFLFVTDQEQYVNVDRELLINYDELPFPVAKSNFELIEEINGFEQQEYAQKLQEFFDAYGVHEDGHASERAAEFILELIDDCE